jgi:IS5 family transposase
VIEPSLAPKFERKDRPGQFVEGQGMLGPTTALVGAGRSNAGRPRTPIRLMASLLYLKHSFNLSDEDVCEGWSESPLWQFFSCQDYYEHRLPCDATQVGRFRHDIGEDGMELLLKATIDPAVVAGTVKDRGAGARDGGHYSAGEGHRTSGGQPAAGDRAPQGGERCQACLHRAEADFRQGR